jgi:uncharacterized membrane protein YqjE
MTIFAAAGRIATTLAAMAATRLELAAVEVQEEARRLLGYLAWTLLAACLTAGAVMLAALFVILLFWDTHRLSAVAAMAVVLGSLGALLFLKVRAGLDARPALLAATLAELRNDVDLIRTAGYARAADDGAAFDPEPGHG